MIETKDFAKELRKFIKSNFKNHKVSVKTKDQKVFIRWYDISMNDFSEPVEKFINEFSKSNYINLKEVEFWREFSLEYMKDNKEWSRERRMKTIKFENVIDLPKDSKINMTAEIANVIYEDDKVNVIFATKDETETITFEYHKSWSHKKYVDKAMNEKGIKPSFNFRYGWDMSKLKIS